MTKKKYQTIEVKGREMMFNLPLFQEMFFHMAKQEGQKIQQYEKHLAEIVFVNDSTVHNWRQSRNCPGSIEIIETLARYWKIPVERLLIEIKPEAKIEAGAKTDAESEQATVPYADSAIPALNPEPTHSKNIEKTKEEDAHMNTTRKFTDREKEAVLRIYDQFLCYMEAFKKTGGFTASMSLPEDEFGPTDDAYTKMQKELMDNLKHAVYREYIDLRDTVYEELKFLVDNGVDSFIYSELNKEGEFDDYMDSVCLDEEMSEEEQEEMLAQSKEDEDSFLLAIYVGTMNYFQDIIDPYL